MGILKQFDADVGGIDETLLAKIGSASLTTTATNLSDAVNELDNDISGISNKVGSATLDTTATNLSDAINEHESDITNIKTGIGNEALPDTNKSIKGNINVINTKVGSASLTTTATDLSGAINEHESDISGINSSLTNLIGFYEEITMPYTPTKQGYLTMSINPSSSSGGYSVVIVTKDGVSKNFLVSSANGNGNTIGIMIPHGATIAQGNSNNVTVTYRYAEIG